MKKEDLEKYKELYEIFEEKSAEIASLKNKYSEYPAKYYDRIESGYDGSEWWVKYIENGRCGDSDDYTYYGISEEEMLSEIEDLENMYKSEYDKREEKKNKIKEAKEAKENIEKEKREKELYEKLKNKYEK